MAERVLSTRELNRAMLARQLLLEHSTSSLHLVVGFVIAVIGRLVLIHVPSQLPKEQAAAA